MPILISKSQYRVRVVYYVYSVTEPTGTLIPGYGGFIPPDLNTLLLYLTPDTSFRFNQQ